MDLDSVIVFINENIEALTLKDEKHLECIDSTDLHGRIKPLLAQRNQTNAYSWTIISDLKKDRYLTSDVQGHVQRGVEMFHFNIDTNGYLAKHDDALRNAEKERQMREAEYGANISAVASADRADRRANRANQWAMVSALCAVVAIILPIILSSTRPVNAEHHINEPQGSGQHVPALSTPPKPFVLVHDSLWLDSLKSK